MFGLGPTEIILIAMVFILLLAAFVAGLIIVVFVIKFYKGKREAGLEARVEALEKRLGERQQK